MNSRRRFLMTTAGIVTAMVITPNGVFASRRAPAPVAPAGRSRINYHVTIHNKSFRKVKMEIFGEWLLKYPDKNNFEKLPSIRKTYNSLAAGESVRFDYTQGYYEVDMTKFYITYLYLDQPQRGWIDLNDCYHPGSKVARTHTCTLR